jgi:hypothetical protein
MAEKAPTAVIPEFYGDGVSTRSVDDLVKAMGSLASRIRDPHPSSRPVPREAQVYSSRF